jgi:N-acetylmuramoyl-L-alanine amidase
MNKIKSIVISSGHGKLVRGASGILDEVDEARRVVEESAKRMRERGIKVTTFHDDVSTSQNENLNRIVDYHNSMVRDVDVSVHFNAYEQVEKPMGTECLYVTEDVMASVMASSIAACGFINRGPKLRTDLFFLNNTAQPAILIEVCFVDSLADAEVYTNNFEKICAAIADVMAGAVSDDDDEEDEEAPEIEEGTVLFEATGRCSEFGGPDDDGVDADEGLAFIYDIEDAPYLFLPESDDNKGLGLARRLNPYVHYVACRWNYKITPKPTLLQHVALVRSIATGYAMKAFPADWGPHEDTGRVADLSPGLMDDLQLQTDDIVEVIFPYLGR